MSLSQPSRIIVVEPVEAPAREPVPADPPPPRGAPRPVEASAEPAPAAGVP